MKNINGTLEDWHFVIAVDEADMSMEGKMLRGKINGSDVLTDPVAYRVRGVGCIMTQDGSFFELGEPLAELEENHPGFKQKALNTLPIHEGFVFVKDRPVAQGVTMPAVVYTFDEYQTLAISKPDDLEP